VILACALTGSSLGGVAACTTFADDTRKVAPPGSAEGGTITAPGAADPGSAECSMSVPAGLGLDSCGGAGGADLTSRHLEHEPNDATNEMLAASMPVCGSATGGDVDRYAYAVQDGECLWISFQAAAGTVHVSGPGFDESAAPSRELAFGATAAGTVTLTVTGANGAYKLAVRSSL
jgi:hypothetical protein